MMMMIKYIIIIIVLIISYISCINGWGTESKQAPKAKIYFSKNFPEFESNFDTPMPIVNRYSYISKITEMGWTEKEARIALEKNKWLLDEAVDYLSRYSNGLRHVAPCLGKNNCFTSKKSQDDTVKSAAGFSFRERLRGGTQTAHRITDIMLKPHGYVGKVLPQVRLINYDSPATQSMPVEAPLSFIEVREKAKGRLSGLEQEHGCTPLPTHIHEAATSFIEELYRDPALLQTLSSTTVETASHAFEHMNRMDMQRLWRVITTHLSSTFPQLDDYQYKRPADRDVGFNHLDTHPPPPAGPMRLVPVAYPKPYIEDDQNICHKVLPPSLPSAANLAAGKGKPVAKAVNPKCKQAPWKAEMKSSDFFVREMQRRIKCAQKDWKSGPPGWLQARLRWEAMMKKRMSNSDIRGRGGYQLPQEAWPVNVPVATQGKCCQKRDLWRKPLVPKTTALRKMTVANAKMKLEDAFKPGPAKAAPAKAAGQKEDGSGGGGGEDDAHATEEQDRPDTTRIGAHADDWNLSPIDDKDEVAHEQALKDYNYDQEPNKEKQVETPPGTVLKPPETAADNAFVSLIIDDDGDDDDDALI